MKSDLTQRFPFLLAEVARLYGRQFDQRAREQIGLSRAQCRLLGALARQGGPLSQAALAELLDLSSMAVTTLCDRMEAGGWIRRAACDGDRRVKHIHLEPCAAKALQAALRVSDSLQAQVLSGFDKTEQQQLQALLRRAHENLLALPGPGGAG
ncbi:MAG: MarR family transcriptional regulator [Rhodoferax sp.]|uniref:MarR family winged helix-turn-helix transcriptional regulator n=1 Tax=Rhodoferax sp. TaxID=50421 RepID=UPI0026208717|nr:MarR family transcriptional regulator [Rhodoferax sp.]MDD5335164.1 MarR family transcriptional regulator [Rhodoferax sp.]